MQSYDRTRCISPCRIEGGINPLRHADLLQTAVDDLPRPDEQRPSILVLIGNAEKSLATKTLFGLRKTRRPTTKQKSCEIYPHLDPLTASNDQPLLLLDWDVRKSCDQWSGTKRNKCYEAGLSVLRRLTGEKGATGDVHVQLLSPFADVFCFFSTDLGGFRQVAQRLARWLEQGRSSTLPTATLPKLIIVTSRFAPKGAAEDEARKAFLWMLTEETSRDPFQQLSAIDVVALLPKNATSAKFRFRRLKEHLRRSSAQVQKSREESQVSFSATHVAAFFHLASAHLAESTNTPFDFVRASRTFNSVASDMHEHFARFSKFTTSMHQLVNFIAPMIASSLLLDSYPPDAHVFDCAVVFDTLYKAALQQVSDAPAESADAVPRSSLVSMVRENYFRMFKQFRDGMTAVSIHRGNLDRFRDQWTHINSSNTCFCCMLRRPQYDVPCGHCVCENCIVVFGGDNSADPWTFHVRCCLLCSHKVLNEIAVRVHPPTAGAGVMCIDGGGTRGIVPLILMKQIQDRIGLPIPLQRFVKVAFGVSIGQSPGALKKVDSQQLQGAIIAIEHYIQGRTLEESIQMFPSTMERVFKQRKSLRVPFLSKGIQLATSYFADGLYSADNIEAVLKEVIGADRSILDCSYATATGTKVGLPVATVSKHPLYRIFTNYNGIGARSRDNDRHIIKPDDSVGKVLLWEIARAVSAAPGIFPSHHIHGVGTSQDAGALENDPELWARSEVSTLFPYSEEPDFVVSLGTGEPGPSNYDFSTEDRRKSGMFGRFCHLLSEKLRDKAVRRASSMASPASHRLNIDFDGDEPRLDDTSSITKLISKVQTDASLRPKIDAVSRCMVASLFYFALEPLRPQCDGDKHAIAGRIMCAIQQSEDAFKALLAKLECAGGRFIINGSPVVSASTNGPFLGKDGNFEVYVKMKTTDRLDIALEMGKAGACKISGSPYSIQKMVAAQGLNAPFGRPDHRKRKRREDDGNVVTKKRRLAVEQRMLR